MGRKTITLSDDIEKEFDLFIKEKYAGLKGAESVVINRAIREYLNKEKGLDKFVTTPEILKLLDKLQEFQNKLKEIEEEKEKEGNVEDKD